MKSTASTISTTCAAIGHDCGQIELAAWAWVRSATASASAKTSSRGIATCTTSMNAASERTSRQVGFQSPRAGSRRSSTMMLIATSAIGM